MKSYRELLIEMANTLAADVNEIQMGYFLSNNWKNFVDAGDAKKQLALRKKKIKSIDFDTQTEKAEAMAKEVKAWAKSNGYSGSITKVWWTARPGILAKAVGREVNSNKNPTDILIQFSDKKFLGLSAKSTKRDGNIAFKNPGMGTIDTRLNTRMNDIYMKAMDKFLKMFPELSKAATKRKVEIRADKKISDVAEEMGLKVLVDIADALYKKMKSMPQKELLKFVLEDLMDAEVVYPRYIKVTGMKSKAVVEDPLKNEKIKALATDDIIISKEGNVSVGIAAGKKRIMKLRVKGASQKMAATLKFSGDPW